MAVLAIRRIPHYEPEIVEDRRSPNAIIGAHADFRHEDFVFPRMQSRAMRETPWGERERPLKSWSEIAVMGAALGLASLALMLSTTLI